MRKFAITLPTTFIVAVILTSAALAASAPSQLRGKSIKVTWGENRTQRIVGEEQVRSVAASLELAIYVSETGRVFNRLASATKAGTGNTEQIAGESGATRVPSFQGQSMHMFQPYQGGMRHLTVDFDTGFSSCNAKVTHARQEGGGARIFVSPIIKKKVELLSAAVTGASCSVQSGNIFGQ